MNIRVLENAGPQIYTQQCGLRAPTQVPGTELGHLHIIPLLLSASSVIS